MVSNSFQQIFPQKMPIGPISSLWNQMVARDRHLLKKYYYKEAKFLDSILRFSKFAKSWLIIWIPRSSVTWMNHKFCLPVHLILTVFCNFDTFPSIVFVILAIKGLSSCIPMLTIAAPTLFSSSTLKYAKDPKKF